MGEPADAYAMELLELIDSIQAQRAQGSTATTKGGSAAAAHSMRRTALLTALAAASNAALAVCYEAWEQDGSSVDDLTATQRSAALEARTRRRTLRETVRAEGLAYGTNRARVAMAATTAVKAARVLERRHTRSTAKLQDYDGFRRRHSAKPAGVVVASGVPGTTTMSRRHSSASIGVARPTTARAAPRRRVRPQSAKRRPRQPSRQPSRQRLRPRSAQPARRAGTASPAATVITTATYNSWRGTRPHLTAITITVSAAMCVYHCGCVCYVLIVSPAASDDHSHEMAARHPRQLAVRLTRHKPSPLIVWC